ncbi:MAG: hypothetical protein EA399_14770 [Desulfovibrionales bacterium]|nr:MAG: hypothetical protein EA399_14770 [Desulfovibrionales bacterium]
MALAFRIMHGQPFLTDKQSLDVACLHFPPVAYLCSLSWKMVTLTIKKGKPVGFPVKNVKIIPVIYLQDFVNLVDRMLALYSIILTMAVDQHISVLLNLNKERRDYADFQMKLHDLYNA